MDPSFTVGAAANLCAIATLGLGLLVFMRKMRRENEGDTRAALAEMKSALQARHEENRDLLNELKVGLGERVSKLEAVTADFVPRREIETKFEHERGNRMAVSDAAARGFERQAADITDLKVRLGGLAQRQDGHDQQMGELKAIVRDGFEKASQKIDRLADTIREART